jgi:lysozyme family protein
MKGVTQKVYDHWRRKNGRDLRSVREITDEELKAIYRFQYWDLVHGDKLPPGVDLAVFDFSVHSGPTRAVRTLQKVMGLRQDGDLGAVTADSLLEHDPVEIIHRLCDARLAAHLHRRTERRDPPRQHRPGRPRP